MARASTAWWWSLLLMLIGTVSSSHFRGGIIMTRPLPGGSQSEVSHKRELFSYLSVNSLEGIGPILDENETSSFNCEDLAWYLSEMQGLSQS